MNTENGQSPIKKPKSFGGKGYGLPMLQSVLFHVLIFGLLYVGYSQREIEPVKKVVPRYIKAVVLEKTAEKPNVKAKTTSKATPKPKPKVKPKPKPKQKAKSKSTHKPKPKPEVKPEVKQKVEPTPILETQIDDDAMDALLAEEEAELKAELKAMEQTAIVAAAKEVEQQRIKDQYAALMQQKIERFWSRPPSARNGMQATLSIKLFPGGDVREVTLMEGSGDAVFDRSAIIAVQKAGYFEVPTDSDIFQLYFSKINLVFRPEDLRL